MPGRKKSAGSGATGAGHTWDLREKSGGGCGIKKAEKAGRNALLFLFLGVVWGGIDGKILPTYYLHEVIKWRSCAVISIPAKGVDG